MKGIELTRISLSLIRIMGEMPSDKVKQLISIAETLLTVKVKVKKEKKASWRYASNLLGNGGRLMTVEDKRTILDAFGIEIYEDEDEKKQTGAAPSFLRLKPEE